MAQEKKIKSTVTAFLLLLVCGVLSVVFETDPLHAARAKRLTIVYTNSLNGNIDYCKCKSDPKGGLVKRATEIKKIRRQFGDIFLFETGDFFPINKDLLLAKYIVLAYRHIGYDAIVPGDQEFIIGDSAFLEYRDRLPFLNNNLRVKSAEWENPFRRYRIIEKGGIKLGVIGTIHGSVFRYYSGDVKNSLKTGNQLNEIRKDVRALKKEGVDLIVLLSHSGYEEDKVLREKLRDVNLIVGGHSQTLLKSPDGKEGRIIVQAGSNGSRIGILELEIRNGKLKLIRNSFRYPDEHQPRDDITIRKLIDEYKKESRKSIKDLRFR